MTRKLNIRIQTHCVECQQVTDWYPAVAIFAKGWWTGVAMVPVYECFMCGFQVHDDIVGYIRDGMISGKIFTEEATHGKQADTGAGAGQTQRLLQTQTVQKDQG